MARPRKPLNMQKGNLTVRQQIEKERTENIVKTSSKNIKKAPKWLVDEVATKEYKRLVKQMEDLDILTDLDINNLGGYCNSYALYIQATKELQGQPLTIYKELPNGSTNIVENPLIKIQKNYANEMRAFAGLVGLTIDSRLKIGSMKVSEENNEVKGKFGDI